MMNRATLLFLICIGWAGMPLARAGLSPQQYETKVVEAKGSVEGPVVRRVMHYQRAEVEKAIQTLQVTLKGHLPTLDGFANQANEPLDQFARGFYECHVSTVDQGTNQTLVQVSSKITAWYTDPDPSKSGYRELTSNGRVESDLLDRIEDALAPERQPSVSSTSRPSPESGLKPPITQISPNVPISAPYIDTPSVAPGARTFALHTSGKPMDSAGITAAGNIEDTDTLRRRREETEKHRSELNDSVQNLEEILRNQSHPTDIAVVRKSGTRVMAKPGTNGAVLFTAESEDEFQVLDSGPEWVHVQISGASRGWIRRSDLTLPVALNTISGNTHTVASENESYFRILRKEINRFQGNWNPLHDKSVTIVWVEPMPTSIKPTPGAAKRDFAKNIFETEYKDITAHDSAVAGVVLVFDSSDGGQIAATLENLKQWQSGILSETNFWQLCLVDPPDLLGP